MQGCLRNSLLKLAWAKSPHAQLQRLEAHNSGSWCTSSVCNRRGHSKQTVVNCRGRRAQPEQARHRHSEKSTLSSLVRPHLTRAVAGVAVLAALVPGQSLAIEEAPAGFVQNLLDLIEGFGPLGPVVYTALVCACELIPLFPTQPLSLASGLLFGAEQGAICMLVGTTFAAAAAFGISRGMGKALAEKVIEHELEERDSANGSRKSSLVSKLRSVEEAIEHGSFWKQAGAILLLRLTPVVPFSASNYLLGLTPLPLAPYLTGTVVGMGCWSVLYASLGGASRSLLARGVSADALLTDLLEKASEYTAEVAIGGLVLGAIAAGVWGPEFVRKIQLFASQQSMSSGEFDGPIDQAPRKDQLVEQMKD